MNRSCRFLRLPFTAAIALASTHGLAVDQAPLQVLATQRYCAQTGVPVPEGGEPLRVNIDVPASGNITDVDLELQTTHQHAGDLTVMLEKVAAASWAMLLDHSRGMPPNGIGCQGFLPHLIFDDEGTNGVAQDRCNQNGPAFMPMGGRFQPIQRLSAFDGLAAEGRYQVTISDPFPGDPGMVQTLCLALTTAGPDSIFANGFD